MADGGDGSVIAWEESGSGRPIVLVHGITEDRRGWDPLVDRLADTYRCVRLDLPGHGASSDADTYDAIAMAGAVATVVAEAGIAEPPLLVGHSLGAVVVTAYASAAPAWGVVNLDQPLNVGEFAKALAPLAPMLRSDAFPEALAAAFAGLGVDVVPEPWRTWLEAKHAAARQDVVLGVWGLVLDTDPDELSALIDPVLDAITVPYLAVHGGDPGDGYGDWLRSHIADATVEVWDGDGHYPHLVEPDRLAARVRAFYG